MSGLFNRLKSRKSGSTHTNTPEVDSPPLAFDEQGFLCPICHQKFNDHTELAEHYANIHKEQPLAGSQADGTVKALDSMRDLVLCKHQLIASEQTRMILTAEIKQQTQLITDLRDELDSLKKRLPLVDLSEGSATNSTPLHLHTHLKHSDDLLRVQQRLAEVSSAKEAQMQVFRSHLSASDQLLSPLGKAFDRNVSMIDTLISTDALRIHNEINQMKQSVRLVRDREKNLNRLLHSLRARFNENQVELARSQQANGQLRQDLEQKIQSTKKLTADFQIEEKQANSYRQQVASLTNDIHELEKSVEDLRAEKKQFIRTTMDGDQNTDQQNLVRQITEEKDQYEQKIKELRLEIKQIKTDRQEIQNDCDDHSKQLAQIIVEKSQFQQEQIRYQQQIDTLTERLNEATSDKNQHVNRLNHELSTARKQFISTTTQLENDLRQARDSADHHKQDNSQLQSQLAELKNQLDEERNQFDQKTRVNASQLETVEKDKNELQRQLDEQRREMQDLEIAVSELHLELHQKTSDLDRVVTHMHNCVDLARKTRAHLEGMIPTNQMNVWTALEQVEHDSKSMSDQTLDHIGEALVLYLTAVSSSLIDSKAKLDEEKSKSIDQDKQMKKLRHEHEKLVAESKEQKHQLETRCGELNQNLCQVSESLSEATRTVDVQREKIASLEDELEQRAKKHEMQLSALKENLASARTELRAATEKLTHLDQIKSEKADIDSRLAVSQDERRVLLERSLASENTNGKLLAENHQLLKKNADLDAALQEIAREYQVIQMQANKINQRRWLNDDDIHSCMKCHQTFSVTQRKHHCRCCGNIFCDTCSARTAVVAASSKKPQRVCEQCYKDLTS